MENNPELCICVCAWKIVQQQYENEKKIIHHITTLGKKLPTNSIIHVSFSYVVFLLLVFYSNLDNIQKASFSQRVAHTTTRNKKNLGGKNQNHIKWIWWRIKKKKKKFWQTYFSFVFSSWLWVSNGNQKENKCDVRNPECWGIFRKEEHKRRKNLCLYNPFLCILVRLIRPNY